MTKKILLHKIISLLGAFIWFVMGVLIMYSIVHGKALFLINIVLGILFILIAFYLYKKSKNITTILTNQKFEGSQDYSYFIFYEIIFVLLSVFVGIVILSGIISRAFFEKLPIFG